MENDSFDTIIAGFEQQLGGLEARYDDEVLAAVELAREAQQKIDSGEIDTSDRALLSELIDELDSVWPQLNQPVIVSGAANYRFRVEDEDEFDEGQIALDAYVALSRGFYLKTDSDEHVSLVHLIQVPATDVVAADQLPTDIHPNLQVDLFATLDSIIEPYEVSFNRAEKWLISTYPGLHHAITRELFDAEGDEGLLAMRNIQFDSYGISKDDTFARKSLEVYLSKSLPLDGTIPYIINGEGLVECHQTNEEGDVSLIVDRLDKRELLVQIVALGVVPDKLRKKQPLTLKVAVQSHDNAAGDIMVIDVNSLTKFQSLKDFYYNSTSSQS